MKVSDIMSRDVLTTTPGATLKESLELLVKRRLNGLVVVEGERVVGVVTKADIFRAILPTQADICEDEVLMKDLEYVEERIFKCLSASVGMIMGAPVITIASNLPIVKAGSIMILRRIKQVPVVDDGKLAGIITLSDILGVLLKKTNGWGGEFLR
ncbi:MAG TPA: CBS domain-containing protein [Geobacteraceae bacterium]|nr:CBS domain-containing protein [Geobacteraceae bacterium]